MAQRQCLLRQHCAVAEPLTVIKIMKEQINFLERFRNELTQWIEKPSVSAPSESMIKIRSAVDLSIELIESNRKILENEKHFYEGGTYLVRFFDGWGDEYLDQYFKMVKYISENHY